MGKMMNMFQSVVDNVKQQHEQQKKRDAEDAAWVRNQPGAEVIARYFQFYFDKKEPGYCFLKENRQCMWINTREEGVELSWQVTYSKPAESFREIAQAHKDSKLLVPFEKIYQNMGGNRGYFTKLDTRAKRIALDNMITESVKALPHIKYNGSFSVKLFQ